MRTVRWRAVWGRWLLAPVMLLAALILWRVGQGMIASASSAARSHPPMSPRSVRFEGSLEEMADGYWRVAGYLVRVPEKLAPDAAGLVLGDLVQVHATQSYDGVMMALAVQKLDDLSLAEGWADDQNRLAVALIELEGTIRELPAPSGFGAWRVDDVWVVVDEATQVQGTPTVGAIAEISGMVQGDGQMRARQILVLGPDDGLVLQGVIIDKAARGWGMAWTLDITDDKEQAGSVRVMIDERTFVDESRGQADIHMWAEVRAVPQADGTLLAQYVRIQRP